MKSLTLGQILSQILEMPPYDRALVMYAVQTEIFSEASHTIMIALSQKMAGRPNFNRAQAEVFHMCLKEELTRPEFRVKYKLPPISADTVVNIPGELPGE